MKKFLWFVVCVLLLSACGCQTSRTSGKPIQRDPRPVEYRPQNNT